ncbi:MAG: hypothetical protein C0412_06425 [Flavobacterium sp.]|nr:hypothetical protein [Flavobacterium sp.]
MKYYKRTLLFLLVFSIISCGKNKENEEHELEQNKQPHYQQKTNVNTESQKKESTFETPDDSLKATKESVLRKQNYKKKKQTVTSAGKLIETPKTKTIAAKPETKKVAMPSFVYIKKILDECKIGVPMTQKELQTNYNIPEEGIQLVKSLTKISSNELDVKWKSTWLIEKMSDAKFKDGRLKVRFDKNKMYTSGNAIAIKYEKKMYTDLILIGRSAYIPTVKGFYWQIGKD